MMLMLCEVCQRPATCNCAGLDVPMLWFCDEHGAEHERRCPDIRKGRSQFTTPKEEPSRDR